jgi:hypothetical protein
VAAPDKRSLCAPRARPFHVERVVHRIHVNRLRSRLVGSFASTLSVALRNMRQLALETGRNQSCTGAQIGLDSDERFVAQAIARACRGDVSKRSRRPTPAHERSPSNAITPRCRSGRSLLGKAIARDGWHVARSDDRDRRCSRQLSAGSGVNAIVGRNVLSAHCGSRDRCSSRSPAGQEQVCRG